MRRVLFWALGLCGGTCALVVALAIFSPVTASRYLWPLVERIALRAPFTGITATGTVTPDLFRLEATGVSTLPVLHAAQDFLASLTLAQRQRASFPIDDLEWRRWANIHISTRQGVGFMEFNTEQKRAALALLRAGLSERGAQTAQDIMRLEGYLSDLMNNHNEYGEQRYWLTLFGEPSPVGPWGWQLEGHHLVINFFVIGDQVVMTPVFMGSEPPRATEGRYAGVSILEAELEAGLAFMNALDTNQRRQAILSETKSGNNNQGELFSDNAIVPYAGLRFDQLNPEQSRQALALVGLYIGHLRDAHAAVKMREILQHWDATYFAWVGATDPDAVFYYRIHSPVVMIEYDHQLPVALDGPPAPSRNHVHSTIRTPNGNDYGKDLSRQHLLQHAH